MRALLTLLASTALTTSLQAQTAVAAKDAALVPSAPAETYAYQPDGRRDPFLSLLNAGTDPRATSKHGDGLGNFALADISVRGVMQSRDALVAMVQGPDNKTYLIHQGDKLADGVVKSVTAQGLVVVQDVTDPLSTQKQREVRKLLRSLEGGK
jgi:Tfp pilus assembly protein PilP